MEYDVVEASSAAGLAKRVMRMVDEGWIPQGGVSAFYNLSGYYYQQAMIRVKEAQ
jgi:hypothetical protein